MKKDIVEYLGFEDNSKNPVGRPKLADKKTKRKSLIIAGVSFTFVILLLIFGYGTLFGFRNLNLKGAVVQNNTNKNVLVEEISPLVKDITIKSGTARKVYLTVLPANAYNKDISYTSSDEKVAQVDSSGKVTALKEGNAIITATTKDGSNLSTFFNIKVIKNAEGKCSFTSLSKTSDGIDYNIKCNNAKIKEIQYKVGEENYEKLLTKKSSDEIKFSNEQIKKEITFKVVYYANNSKVSKYSTKTYKTSTVKKTEPTGSCTLNLKDVKSNQAKYDITCNNASVTNIAYKIGNGSYVGLDASSLADTVLFEESDVTRVIYFNVEYKIDGTNRLKTITKSTIIEKGIVSTTSSEEEWFKCKRKKKKILLEDLNLQIQKQKKNHF